MGMFDTIYVAQSLIEQAIKDTEVKLEPFKGYCSFQTKDLDNCLLSFYIREDNSFVVEKQEYEYTKSDIPDISDKKNWSLNSLQETPVGEPQMITDNRTTYIEFYDLYSTEEERFFVKFKAHVKNGNLAEPITISSVERTNLKQEAEELKKTGEKWSKAKDTWQWKLATFIFEVRWRVKRIFNPFFRKLDNLENNLRNKATERNGL